MSVKTVVFCPVKNAAGWDRARQEDFRRDVLSDRVEIRLQ